MCLSVCLSLTPYTHYCTDPDVTWRNGRGCPLVMHYRADLQSVHGFRCYDNIAPNAKCQRVLVLALCLVLLVVDLLWICATSCRILWNVADLLLYSCSICCRFVANFVVQLVVQTNPQQIEQVVSGFSVQSVRHFLREFVLSVD